MSSDTCCPEPNETDIVRQMRRFEELSRRADVVAGRLEECLNTVLSPSIAKGLSDSHTAPSDLAPLANSMSNICFKIEASLDFIDQTISRVQL